MIDLNELQFFVRVSKAQSFTTAAKQLGVPKSSVSRAIARLESRLGVRLVERTTRTLALTEAGEIYLDRCQRVLEEAEQAELSIGALHAKPRGILRVGAPVTFTRFILAPILGKFLALYPELRLHLQLPGGGISPREKNLDIVIRPGPLEDSGLLVKPLMRIRLGAYASPKYLEIRSAPDSPADLRHQSCITATCGPHGEPGDSAIWRLRRGSDQQEVRVESRVSVPDPTINHQLALAGVGVALLSQSAARLDVEQGRLVRLLPDWEPEPVELHAVYPSPLNSSPKVRAFLQFLREHFSGDPLLEFAPIKPKTTGSKSQKSVKKVTRGSIIDSTPRSSDGLSRKK
jgi:LysR family transcriptional regulator, transcriptional activator for dmlA